MSKNSQVKEASEQLQKEVSDLTGQYIKAMEEIKMRDGISKAMAISSRANKFIQVFFRSISSHVCKSTGFFALILT